MVQALARSGEAQVSIGYKYKTCYDGLVVTVLRLKLTDLHHISMQHLDCEK